MSPHATQQWTRRIRSGDQHIRVSDAERNAVAEHLSAHYADGRLDQAEFDDRVGRTMAAKTRGDLAGLFDDLPDVTRAGAAGTSNPGDPVHPPIGYPRGSRGAIVRPILLLVLVLACVSAAWHAFASLFFIQPLALAILLTCTIVILSRFTRRYDR